MKYIEEYSPVRFSPRYVMVALLLVLLAQPMRTWAEAYARLSTDLTTLTFYDNDSKTTDDYALPTATAQPGWSDNSTSVTTVVFDQSFAQARPTTCRLWFRNMSRLTSVRGIENLNTSEVTDMQGMFDGCAALTQLDLSGFQTSKVSAMSGMFSGCTLLQSLDVSGFDTRQVTEMDMMFSGCKQLETLDLTSFSTSAVLSTSQMFADCASLKRIDVSSKFVMTQVSYSDGMFSGCTSLTGAVAYDSSKTDVTMANGQTGYLTLVKRTYVRLTDQTLTFSYDADYEGGEYSLPTAADEAPAWASHAADIEKVVFDDSFAQVRPTTCYEWFSGMSRLSSVEGMANLNGSEVTTTHGMFKGCESLTSLDMSSFQPVAVTDMSQMFEGCKSLTGLVLTTWSNPVTENMEHMFYGCSSLSELNLEKFGTSAVTTMSGMFYGCTSLTQLDLSSFDTDKVTDMSEMFAGCESLTSLKVSSFYTQNVTTMAGMFYGCTALTALDLASLRTSNVEDMSRMFGDCSSLTALDLSCFDTRKVTDMSQMFYGDAKLEKITVNDFFVTDQVTQSTEMFAGCTALPSFSSSSTNKAKACYSPDGYLDCAARCVWIGFDDETQTLTFHYDNIKPFVQATAKYDLPASGVEPSWLERQKSVAHVVFDKHFAEAHPVRCHSWFYNMTNLTDITGIEYLNTDSANDLSYMFFNCSSLKEVDLKGLNTSNVTTMKSMFFGCSSLTELDVSKFSTSKVDDMSEMFENCQSLTSLDLSSFNTSNVNNMSVMFRDCLSLTELDLSSFDTRKVTIMSQMFHNDSKLEKITVTDLFVTDQVTRYTDMFKDCTSLPGFTSDSVDKSKACYTPDGYFDSAARSAWVEYEDATKTLTFRYDNIRQYVQATAKYDLPTSGVAPAWLEHSEDIEKVVIEKRFAEVSPTTCESWFSGMSSLTSVEGLSYLNSSEVTTTSAMFKGCSSLSSLDLSSFATDKVTDMSKMFYGCKALESLDLSSFNTANVTLMNGMFDQCESLKDVNLSRFDTHQVSTMDVMFFGCTALTTLDLKSFNTSAVRSTVGMFCDCSALTRIDVSRDFVMTEVSYSGKMFDGCSSLVGAVAYDREKTDASMAQWETGYLTLGKKAYARLTDGTLTFYYDTDYEASDYLVPVDDKDAPDWTENSTEITKVVFDERFAEARPTTCYEWFSNMPALTTIEGIQYLNTSKVTNMEAMFLGCKNLTDIDLTGFDTRLVTNMQRMFAECGSLKTLDLSSFNTAAVQYTTHMFYGCSSLTTIVVSKDFVTKNVTASDGMFEGCTSLVGAVEYDSSKTDVSQASWTTGYLTLMVLPYARYSNGRLTFYYDTDYRTSDYRLPTEEREAPGWLEHNKDITMVCFSGAFSNVRPTSCYRWFYGMSNLTRFDLIEYYFNTSEVTCMAEMFAGCTSLKHLNNAELTTDLVTDMSGMFAGCESMTELGLTTFHTSKVTTMKDMFADCPSLTSLDLASFNTGCVEDMSEMFADCKALKTIEVSKGFVTTSVTASVDMFTGCDVLVGAVPFDSEKTDAEMATWTTGYLTLSVRPYVRITDNVMTFYYNTDYEPTDYCLNDTLEPSEPRWYDDADNITKAVFDESFADARPRSTVCWFVGLQNLTDIENLKYLNTSKVVDMNAMFAACTKLRSIDLSSFKTDSLQYMGYMFAQCTSLESLDLSSFNTENVEEMCDMFNQCKSLRSLNLSSFNTSKVSEIDGMFMDCPSLESLDLSSFNTENTEYMTNMFDGCESLRRIYVSRSFVTTSSDYSGNMFGDCTSLVGAIPYDSLEVDGDMASWTTGYLTLKVGTNGDELIGAVGDPLSIVSLPLADDKAFSLDEECPATEASYSRTVKNHWATLCLPFAFDADDNTTARFYSVTQYDNANLSVDALTGTVAAGTPVLAYTEGSEISVTATDADVVAAPVNTEANVLKGVFTKTTVGDDDYIIANDHFWNAGWLMEKQQANGVYVAPYRAYLTLTGISGSINCISIADGAATGIESIDGEASIENILDGAELYDLQGRRLSAPQRGVMIVRKGGQTRKVLF